MVTYITRRLLLMIPTLLGITFMVFMIIALSPGGIGAALKAEAGGAQQSQTNQAVTEAYMDDRYGLDDPPIFQYLRWLGRISPIKFGKRDQVAPNGDRFSEPRRIKEPATWRWFTDALPQSQPVQIAAPTNKDGLVQMFKVADREYAERRAEFVAANALLKDALGAYAKSVGATDAIGADSKIIVPQIAKHEANHASAEWPKVEKLGQAAVEAYRRAVDAREQLAAVFDLHPYRRVGVPILPDTMNLSAPDMGVSFGKSQPVIDLLLRALPITLLLNAIATPIIYLVAIPTGMLAAVRKGTIADTALGSIFIMLYSFPVVLAGTLAIGFLASKQYLGWFPASGLHSNSADSMLFLPGRDGDGLWSWGFIGDTIWHLILPVLCIVYGGFAVLSKMTRSAMLDNYSADYVRTAKAKGVSNKDVIFRHIFRNSLIPLITIFVSIFPSMLAGSIVIERIFSVPGMGLLLLEAINLRDRELVLADTLMGGVVTLLALLLADILYALSDPRVAYE